MLSLNYWFSFVLFVFFVVNQVSSPAEGSTSDNRFQGSSPQPGGRPPPAAFEDLHVAPFLAGDLADESVSMSGVISPEQQQNTMNPPGSVSLVDCLRRCR